MNAVKRKHAAASRHHVAYSSYKLLVRCLCGSFLTAPRCITLCRARASIIHNHAGLFAWLRRKTARAHTTKRACHEKDTNFSLSFAANAAKKHQHIPIASHQSRIAQFHLKNGSIAAKKKLESNRPFPIGHWNACFLGQWGHSAGAAARVIINFNYMRESDSLRANQTLLQRVAHIQLMPITQIGS